jgi:hypothetical protein
MVRASGTVTSVLSLRSGLGTLPYLRASVKLFLYRTLTIYSPRASPIPPQAVRKGIYNG